MTDIVSIGLNVDSSSVDKGTESLNKLGKQSNESSTATEKLNQSWSSMAAQVAAAVTILGGSIAIIKASVQAADEYNKALTGLASIARYAGQDVGGTLNTAMKLTEDGLMSTTEAATALKNLLAKGFSTDEAVQMINRLKDSAAFGRQSTLGLAEAVVGATEGIKNENSMMIDNAGVTKNAAVMIEEYAKSLGKTAKSLSEAEKRSALFNGILKETEGQAGNAALASQGLTGSQSRLSKSINETAVTIGQAFMPAAIALIDILSSGMQFLNDNVIKPAIFAFKNLGITLGEMVMKAGAFLDLITSSDFILDNAKAVDKFKTELKSLGDVAEEERIRVANSMNEVATPEIGNDTGARRKDVEEAKAIANEVAEIESINYESSLQRLREKNMTESELIAQKTIEDQLLIDEAYLAKQLSEEEHQKMMADINANYAAQITDNKIKEDKRMADSEAALNQIMFNGKATVLNQIAGLIRMFAGENKVMAVAAIAIEKGVAMAQTFISGTAAAEAAGAHAALMGGMPAYLAAKNTVMGMTKLSMGLIAATGIAQASQTLSGGSSGGGYSGSSGGSGSQGVIASPNMPQQGQFNVQPPVTRELRVTVESDGPNSEGMRAFARNLAETIKDMGGTDRLVVS